MLAKTFQKSAIAFRWVMVAVDASILCVPVLFFCRRCHLYVRPTGTLEGQFRESTTYIAWREELHRSNEVKCLLQCPATEMNFLPLIVSSTAVPDQLNFISASGEEWDPAYIIHLYPTLTVRNLLPYSLRYLLEVGYSMFLFWNAFLDFNEDLHTLRTGGESSIEDTECCLLYFLL